MNPERKAEWIAALRSGEYTQGHHALNVNDCHCTFGVAAELAHRAGVLPKEKRPTSSARTSEVLPPTTYAYGPQGGNVSMPPDELLDWLGINYLQDRGQLVWKIIDGNDSLRLSFEQMADLIEALP